MFSSMECYYQGKILRGKLGDMDNAEWIKSTKKYNGRAVKKNHKQYVTVRVEKVRKINTVKSSIFVGDLIWLFSWVMKNNKNKSWTKICFDHEGQKGIT